MKDDYSYNNQFLAYEKEIESLNQKISDLEVENRNYKLKIFELSKTKQYLNQIENNNKILNDTKKKNFLKIRDLENEVLKITEDSKEENRNLQKNLEAEILYYKGLNETGLSKIYNADKIIKLNETQHNYILKLEAKIDEIKNENNLKLEQLQLEHERHYIKLKRQMMDYIQKAQQDMNKNNEYNLELNTKFGILYKNQMLNELEHQSLQIIDLLKLKEKHEKIIFVLQQELKTHKQVEEIITKKKDEYLELAKKNIEKNKLNKSQNKNIKNEKNISLLNIDKGNCLTDRNLYNDGKFHKLNKKEYHNYKSLEKIYKELLEDYKFIKNKYNTLKDKEKMFQDKNKGIIKLLDEALEELLKDEEIKNRDNIYININDLNKGDYEKFTKEEKYSILVALINRLLPLIKINDNEKNLNLLKDKINNIEFKMNKTQITKFSDSSRCQTIRKPFFGITSNNFFNISTNNESNLNSERNQFVSLFGDDFIQYGKRIFTERGSVKKEKNGLEKFMKKRNKIKYNTHISNNMIKKIGSFAKTNTFIENRKNKVDSTGKKLENSSEKKDIKKIGYRRGNTFERKLVRVMKV